MAEEIKPRYTPRAVYLALVVVSWVLLVVLMWQAFRTVPSAEALSDARHVPPPLPRDFLRYTLESLAQVVLVCIALWPWWQRAYIWRTLATSFVLMGWFLFSVPMQLNNMIWIERRWLALLILSLIVTVIVASIVTLIDAARRGSAQP